MVGCSEDLLARPRTEDNCSSRAPRPPRGKSPDRRQRVPGAAALPPAAASRTLPLRRPRAERVSAGRALVTATDTQVARQARQQNGAHSQAIPLLPGGASHGTVGGWLVPPGAAQPCAGTAKHMGGETLLPRQAAPRPSAAHTPGLQVPPGAQNHLGWKTPLRSWSSTFHRTPSCQPDHGTKSSFL